MVGKTINSAEYRTSKGKSETADSEKSVKIFGTDVSQGNAVRRHTPVIQTMQKNL